MLCSFGLNEGRIFFHFSLRGRELQSAIAHGH